MDAEELVEGLPFKKRATVQQLILLALAIIFLLGLGWRAQAWFSGAHNEVMSAIAAVAKTQEVRIDALQAVMSRADAENEAKIMMNSRAIEAIRKYNWTNADMQRWAQQLERVNRKIDLAVPDVPAPAKGQD